MAHGLIRYGTRYSATGQFFSILHVYIYILRCIYYAEHFSAFHYCCNNYHVNYHEYIELGEGAHVTIHYNPVNSVIQT